VYQKGVTKEEKIESEEERHRGRPRGLPLFFIAWPSGNSGIAVVEWPAVPGQNIAVQLG
jgi:hypothetical protein